MKAIRTIVICIALVLPIVLALILIDGIDGMEFFLCVLPGMNMVLALEHSGDYIPADAEHRWLSIYYKSWAIETAIIAGILAFQRGNNALIAAFAKTSAVIWLLSIVWIFIEHADPRNNPSKPQK